MEVVSVLHTCMNKRCDWKMATPDLLDAVRCPKCDGLVWSELKQKSKSEEDHNKMAQSQEKAKEKIFNLLQDYDIEYIDHNVREDEYSISLVSKDKKKEE